MEMLYYGFVYLFMNVVYVSGHPQCLDSRPPFQPGRLQFCTAYQEYGCCTWQDDLAVKARYERLRLLIPPSKQHLWTTCASYAQTFMCQTCSPYAAHLFDAEISVASNVPDPRAIPGMCRGYCGTFYQNCKDFVQYYMQEAGRQYHLEATKLETAIATGEAEFCTAAQILDLDYCYPELLTNPILTGNITIEKVTQDGCLCMQPFQYQFRNPIFLKHAGDGSKRMFVGEQIGLVHIMKPDGSVLAQPFVDIRADIKTTYNKGDERGMLGMEFHPKYLENRKFYIYYSTPLDPYESQQQLGNHKIRIEEFKVSVDNPNQVDYNYSRIILEVYEPFWNHNGGEIMFDDDGFLLLFIGDGGNAGDPYNSGQNLDTMLGKVLRIDVDKVDMIRQKEYSIPADNPYADGIKALPEIYAYGVRNIWRCGKDRGDPKTANREGKGRIVCGDVGQSAVEEIDLLEKGANYGWNLKEGSKSYCSNCNQTEPEKNLTEPIWDYPHSIGKSVTGGNFYRGCESPNLNGFYIYGDFMSGRLFRLLQEKNSTKWNNKELKMCGSDWCTPPLVNDYSTSIISFGEDEQGEIYMLSTSFASTSEYQGTVYKIVDPVRRGNPAQCGTYGTTPTTFTPTSTSTKGTISAGSQFQSPLSPTGVPQAMPVEPVTAPPVTAPPATAPPLTPPTTTPSGYVSVSYTSILELIQKWLAYTSQPASENILFRVNG